MRRRTWLLAVAVALATSALSAAAAQAKAIALVAHGSVQQVYAVGLKPHATVSLLNRRGRAVAAQKADALGGIVFRNVTPGRGYRLRRGQAIRRGHRDARSPGAAEHEDLRPDAPRRRLRLPDHARRDQAGDRRPPARAGAAGPYPTLIEYSGYGYADPAGAAELDQRRSPTSSASLSSTSTCAAPAARAARSTTSSRSRASTATT